MARAGIGRSSPSAIRPRPRTSWAKQSACGPRLPVASIATPPSRAPGAKTNRPRGGRPRDRLRALSRSGCQSPRVGIRVQLSGNGDCQPGIGYRTGCHTKRCSNCPHPRSALAGGSREKPDWVRSQGAGWTWSRCNTESARRGWPITCHDPKAVRSATATEYGPNASPATRSWRVQPAGGATPVTRAQLTATKGLLRRFGEWVHQMPHAYGVRMDSSHREFTNHYIRIQRCSADSRGSVTSQSTR